MKNALKRKPKIEKKSSKVSRWKDTLCEVDRFSMFFNNCVLCFIIFLFHHRENNCGWKSKVYKKWFFSILLLFHNTIITIIIFVVSQPNPLIAKTFKYLLFLLWCLLMFFKHNVVVTFYCTLSTIESAKCGICLEVERRCQAKKSVHRIDRPGIPSANDFYSGAGKCNAHKNSTKYKSICMFSRWICGKEGRRSNASHIIINMRLVW